MNDQKNVFGSVSKESFIGDETGVEEMAQAGPFYATKQVQQELSKTLI